MSTTPTLTIELERVVAFHPQIANAIGSIYAALLWQQIYYWQKLSKREDGFVYKSAADIKLETAVNTYQQRKARALLLEKGLLEEKKIHAHGVPTIHYRVNVLRMQELLILPPSKNAFCEGEKMHFATVEKSLTKNTPKTTTNSKPAASPAAEAVCNEEMQELVDAFKPVNPTGYLKFFKNTTQREALVRLAQHMGVKELKRKIDFLTKHNEETNTWKIFSPTQLEERLSAMESFWTERKNKLSAKPRLTAGRSPEGAAVVKTADGWQTRETGETYAGDVISEEDYQQRRNALKTAAIAACGKCSSGWVSSATGERLCPCIENL